MDGAIHFKSENESVHFLLSFSFTIEIEVKGETGFGGLEKGHDKEQCEVVIKRVAYEDRLAAVSC